MQKSFLIKTLFFILLVSLIFSAITCQQAKPETASPSAVLKTFIEAKLKKDAETIKKTLSADSLRLYNDLALQQNVPVNSLLTDNTGSVLTEVPPMRNEKIEGETASVEAQVPQTGVWQKFPFVKETDGWKIAMDKIVIESIKKGQEKVDETLKNQPPAADKKTDKNENKTNK